MHESTYHSESICFTTFQKAKLIIITFTFLISSIYHFSWFLKRPSSRKNKIFLCLELHVPWKPCNQIGSLPEMIPQSLQCRRCSGNHFLATKEEKLHLVICLTLIDPLILNMFIFMYSHWHNILQCTTIVCVCVIPIRIYVWQDYLVCQKFNLPVFRKSLHVSILIS